MNVPLEDFCNLPWHDADIHRFTVNCSDRETNYSERGIQSVQIPVEINPYEDLSAFKKLGLSSARVTITFTKCWMIETRIVACNADGESISTVDLLTESGLLTELRCGPCGSPRMRHVRISGSGGSVLDIVAECVAVDETETPAR
jgi:hypothetical protein